MDSKHRSEKKLKNSRPNLLLAVTGITVSPAITHLDLATDPTAFTLKYTNSTDHSVQLTFSAKDFTSLENGWRIQFLNPNDAQNYRYSLSSWLEFSPPGLLLKPGASSDLQVNVRGQSLSAGGHYASIVADIAAAPPTGGAIAIKSQLVSLVFVRAATGHEHDEASIAGFSAINGNIFSLPQTYILHFNNSGNTELVPHGLVVVRDIFNREISRGILNEDSLITLPESVRRFDIPVSVKSNHWLLPGPYQALLTVNYGSARQTLASSFPFFSFGSRINLVILVLIPLLLVIFLRRILKKVKRRQHPGPQIRHT